MLKLSETYMLGIDIDEDDKVEISVVRRIGSRLDYIKTIEGQEAKELYEKITNKCVKGGKQNEY